MYGALFAEHIANPENLFVSASGCSPACWRLQPSALCNMACNPMQLGLLPYTLYSIPYHIRCVRRLQPCVPQVISS